MQWCNLEELEPVPDEWKLFPYINNRTIYEYSEVMILLS